MINMDLWIRSQDKMKLIQSKELFITDDKEFVEDPHDTYTICSYGFDLGTYKTKERALEVLDEIQNIIYMNKLFNANVNAFKLSLEELDMSEDEMNSLLKKISVYEMPQE